MRNALLALLCVASLALAGNLLAQTDQSATGSSTPTAQPADTQSAAPATTADSPSTTSQSATPSGESGSSVSDTAGSNPPSGDPPPTTGTDPASTQHRLPKTASPIPLALAFGLTALAGSAALRTYRLRHGR